MVSLPEKAKVALISAGIGLFFGFQASSSVPGYTDVAFDSDSLAILLGIGSAIGFFVGLANLSKANPNPHRTASFFGFVIAGIVVLSVNLYRGFIDSSFVFNDVSVIALAYLPAILVGGYAASVFSKSPERGSNS